MCIYSSSIQSCLKYIYLVFRQMYITNFALQRVQILAAKGSSANTDTNVLSKDGYKLNHS